MIQNWQDIGDELGPRCGPETATGLDPALVILLLEVIQQLLKCYLQRTTASPRSLVNMARRRSRAFRLWLRWHLEAQCRTAAAYTALGGDRTADAIIDILSTVDRDRADELFYRLAVTSVRPD